MRYQKVVRAVVPTLPVAKRVLNAAATKLITQQVFWLEQRLICADARVWLRFKQKEATLTLYVSTYYFFLYFYRISSLGTIYTFCEHERANG